jgi:hypothetical protein
MRQIYIIGIILLYVTCNAQEVPYGTSLTGSDTLWLNYLKVTNTADDADAPTILLDNVAGGRRYDLKALGSGHLEWTDYNGGSPKYLFGFDGLNAKVYTTETTLGLGIARTDAIANPLSVKGAVSIGASYINIAAPANGLISEGTIAIGTSAPAASSQLQVSDGTAILAGLIGASDKWLFTVNNTAPGLVGIVASNTVSHRMVFKGTRARGTTDVPTKLSADDDVVSLLGVIWDSSTGRATGEILFEADGASLPSVAPQRISFLTGATTSRTERMRITSGGLVGIGVTPTTILHVKGADNTTVQTIEIAATQANVTAADIFMDFRSSSGSEGTIAGTAVAGVIAFNTFTGAHYAQKQNEAENMITGMIVSATGNVMPGGDYLPMITKSTGRNDKAVYGVYASKIADGYTTTEIDSLRGLKRLHDSVQVIYDSLQIKINGGDTLIQQISVPPIPSFKGHTLDYAKGHPAKDLHQVFAVGTGVILVTDAGGNIAVGDFIASSPTRGLGERQTIGGLGVTSDPVEYGYTAAKATVNVDFATVPVHPQLGVKVKMIPCTYAF